MLMLDACCGLRMMWFSKENQKVVYMDIRKDVNAQLIADFRCLPFPDLIFDLVVFDPPHVITGPEGIFTRKFGTLRSSTFHIDFHKATNELFRVLKQYGFLIFKWNTHTYPLKRILPLFPCKPLFGQRSAFRTKHASSTYWFTFQKLAVEGDK